MSKTRPFGANRCINRGEYGPHFVPPSFGQVGFYSCHSKDCLGETACSCHLSKPIPLSRRPLCGSDDPKVRRTVLVSVIPDKDMRECDGPFHDEETKP